MYLYIYTFFIYTYYIYIIDVYCILLLLKWKFRRNIPSPSFIIQCQFKGDPSDPGAVPLSWRGSKTGEPTEITSVEAEEAVEIVTRCPTGPGKWLDFLKPGSWMITIFAKHGAGICQHDCPCPKPPSFVGKYTSTMVRIWDCKSLVEPLVEENSKNKWLKPISMN